MRVGLRGAVAIGFFALVLTNRAYAQQQSLSLNLGWFSVRGEDARVTDDVLVQNLDFLAFRIPDFNGTTVSAEWLIGLGDFLDAGVGAGFYRRTVLTVYTGHTHLDGFEIEQDLRLRIVPIALTARWLPLGRRSRIEPYVGGGVAIYRWRYSETGEFVDFSEVPPAVFRDRFVAEDTDMGPVFLAGLRARVSDRHAIGGEFRYQGGKGTVGVEHGFLGDRIDLGGYTSMVTFQFRF